MPSPPAPSPSPPWAALLVVCGLLALHNVMRTAPVTLVEELRLRYAVDYARIGNVIGAYTLTYGLAQLAAGLLTDRAGSRRLMLLGLALAAIGATAFAAARSYPVALAARLLMGVAGGCLYTPTLAYAFAAFPPGLRGRVMGFAEAGVGAGQVLAVVAIPLLFGWLGLTGAFLAIPLAAVGLAAAVGLGLRPIAAARRASLGSGRALARSRDFWLLLVGFAFVGMLAQVAVLAWLPTYLRRAHGFGVTAAGLSTGIVVAGLMVFSPVFGAVSDRAATRRAVMLTGAAMAVAGFAALLAARNPALAVAGAVLVSASMAATIPTQAVFASERFGAVGAGAAIGIVNAGGQVAASIGGPLYGALLDRGLGFAAVWSFATALGLVRVAAVLGLREPPRR